MEQEKTPPLIAAWTMLALLTSATLVTGATFYTAHDTLFTATSLHDFIVGKTAAAFEDAYEDNLSIRDDAVHSWTAMKYGLFNTGNDGVVIGKGGWLFTDEEYKTVPNAHAEEAAKVARVVEVRDYLAAHGIELMVALLPAKSRMYAEHTRHPHPPYRVGLYQRFREALLRENIWAPDMLSAFEQAKQDTKLFMRTDTHWTPDGAELAASVLAAAVQQDCAALALESKAFTTTKGKRTSHDGDLLRFIPTGGFKRWVGPRGETYISRKTGQQAEGEVSADALFGGQNIPVALVGTSYSQQEFWNFEGALKDALHADVINTASEGKGPFEPMAKFLKETDFNNTTLKLVVWEIPERFIPMEYKEVEFPDLTVAAHGLTTLSPTLSLKGEGNRGEVPLPKGEGMPVYPPSPFRERVGERVTIRKCKP